MRVRYAYYSTEGSARENNEDSVIARLPDGDADARWRTHGALIAIADGMGGQVRGEVASAMACERVAAAFDAAAPMAPPAALLRAAFDAANLAIYEDNHLHRRDWGRMATTLTVALFRDDELTIAHVGDCRAYLVQANRIRLLTADHSAAASQLRMGLITAEDAADSELRSALTRCVGHEPFVRADLCHAKVRPGDVVVLCCDGLWSKVTEGEILQLSTKHEPAHACRELIRLAEKRFADDNLTVQIVRVVDIERRSDQAGGRTVYWKEGDAHMSSDLKINEVLDDRYRIDDVIARSGMATIYKARDLADAEQRPVALKVPFLQFEMDPAFYSRFEREQKIGHALDHPYVLKLVDDPARPKSRPYMVMEYLKGQTLGERMRASAPMPVDEALRLAGRVCEALEYLHAHDVVHRDLKPDNVMICDDGSIRVMDFGIARYDGLRRLTFGAFTPAMGTPDYMAPEQVRGKRGDRRTDLYSLGAILYEMLTDRPPFGGANPFVIMNSRVTGDPPAPRQFNPAITPQIEEIVLHALARRPEDRYATAAAMKADLDAPETVRMTGRADRLIEPHPVRARWRKYRLLALGVGLPLLAALAFWLSRHVQFK